MLLPDGGGITDDTQMTLFTAEGLIRARRRFDSGHVLDELPNLARERVISCRSRTL